MSAPLQVLIQGSGDDRLVAGLPPSLRSAHLAAAELKPVKIVFCASPPEFPRRYQAQLQGLFPIPAPCANGETAGTHLDVSLPLLVLGSGGFPRYGALESFLAEAAKNGAPARWVIGSEAVAAYYPKAGNTIPPGATATQVAQEALKLPYGSRGIAAGDRWLCASHPQSIEKAEQALCDKLPKDTDGYLARFDRKLSIALSRALLKTPVTPNQITAASLALGLLGAWWLASGSQAWQFIGSLLLWFCCILDGCDGEVARLKLLCSSAGAAFDLWADHLAHLATFIAIPIGMHRLFPGEAFAIPAILLVSGVSISGLSVWWLLLRNGNDHRKGPASLVIERLASRDYVYLIVLLAALGKLNWFVWAAGLGSHVFYLSLWASFGTWRTSQR